MSKVKYAKFCRLFELAEKRIKQCETLEQEPIIPAINQLRYAACHMKRSFQTDDPDKEAEAIRSAERHCQRAIYDASGATIDYICLWVEEFERGFSFIPLTDVIDDHLAKKRRIREAVEFAANHNHEEIEETTDQMQQYMDDLLEIRLSYDDAREELKKRARIATSKHIMLIAGTVAAVVTALVLSLKWLLGD